jgi:hypothetical protein
MKMRKVEINRGLRAGAISSVPAEGQAKSQFLAGLEAEYPVEDGWEVVNTHLAGVNGNSIGLVVFLVQYEYVAE